MLEKDAGNRICPFMFDSFSNGNIKITKCLMSECMAWQFEEIYSDQEWGEPCLTKKIGESKTQGYCKRLK